MYYPVILISFISAISSLLMSERFFILVNIFFYRRLIFTFSLFIFFLNRGTYPLFSYPICFLHHYVSLHTAVQVSPRQQFRQICLRPWLENGHFCPALQKQNSRPKVYGSTTISGAVVTSSNEFQRYIYSVEPSRGPDLDFIIIQAMLLQKLLFPIPFSYEFHSTSLEDVRETLMNVSKYDFFVWYAQAMTETSYKCH